MTRTGLLWLTLTGCGGAIPIAGDDDTDPHDETDTDTHTDACQPVPEQQNLADDDCDGLVDEDFVAEGDVALTEVMVAPAAAVETVGEWLEVENRSDRTVDLMGWELLSEADETWAVPASLLLAPGERAVLGASADPAANGGVIVDLAYDRASIGLANTDDKVALAVGGREVSSASWLDAPIGASLSRDPEFADVWCASVVPLASGDFGTPAAVNEPCGSIDRDGDGWTPDDGDCDDDDPATSPENAETWNGTDDDCNAVVDDVTIDDVAIGWLDGRTDERLGFASALSYGDLDHDGADDLILGGIGVGPDGYGGAYLVPSSAAAGATGYAALASFATALADRYSMELSAVGPVQADVTGDGVADLVIAGRSPLSDLVVFEGHASVSGDMERGASFTAHQDSNDAPRLASHGDLDGDGLSEILTAGSRPYAQPERVYIVQLANLPAGATVLAEADIPYVEADAYGDGLGAAVSAGDADGDGYDDLLATAPDADPNGISSGYAYVVSGGPELVPTGAIGGLAAARISGASTGLAFGLSGGPVLFDADGDLAAELAVGSITASSVWVFDTASLSGERSTADARTVITAAGRPAYFGSAVTAGDLDGDGRSELVVAATDDAEWFTRFPSGADEPGAVFLFSAGAFDGATMDASFGRVLLGNADADLFGSSLATPDLDGDGDADLMVASPGYAADAGRVWFSDVD